MATKTKQPFNSSLSRVFSYANSRGGIGGALDQSFSELLDSFVDDVVALLKQVAQDIRVIQGDPTFSKDGQAFHARQRGEKALDEITTMINTRGKQLSETKNIMLKTQPSLPSLFKYSMDRARSEFTGGMSQNAIDSFMGSSRLAIELGGIMVVDARIREIREAMLSSEVDTTQRIGIVTAAIGQGDRGFEVLQACLTAPAFQQIVSEEVLREAIAGWMQTQFPDAYQSLRTLNYAIDLMRENGRLAIQALSDAVPGPLLDESLRTFQSKIWGYVPGPDLEPRTDTPTTVPPKSKNTNIIFHNEIK